LTFSLYFCVFRSGPDDIPAAQAIFKYSSYLSTVKKPGTPAFKKFTQLRKEATDTASNILKKLAGHGITVKSELTPFSYKSTAELWKSYVDALKKLDSTIGQIQKESPSSQSFKLNDLKGLEVIISPNKRGLTANGSLCLDNTEVSDWASIIVREASAEKRLKVQEQSKLRKERERHLAKELGFLEFIPDHFVANTSEVRLETKALKF